MPAAGQPQNKTMSCAFFLVYEIPTRDQPQHLRRKGILQPLLFEPEAPWMKSEGVKVLLNGLGASLRKYSSGVKKGIPRLAAKSLGRLMSKSSLHTHTVRTDQSKRNPFAIYHSPHDLLHHPRRCSLPGKRRVTRCYGLSGTRSTYPSWVSGKCPSGWPHRCSRGGQVSSKRWRPCS